MRWHDELHEKNELLKKILNEYGIELIYTSFPDDGHYLFFYPATNRMLIATRSTLTDMLDRILDLHNAFKEGKDSFCSIPMITIRNKKDIEVLKKITERSNGNNPRLVSAA